MRKFLALIMALTMVLSLATTAFAAEGETAPETYSITINNKNDGHTYEAYQIFAGDLSNAAENDADPGTNAVLANVAWGESVANVEALGEAGAYAKALAEGTKTVDDLIADIRLGEEVAVSADKGDTYVIEGLEAGYYLIKDLDGSLNGKDEAYTEFIMEVLEDSTVTPKSSVPSVEKKVDDKNDSNTSEDEVVWNDSADYDIKDAVPFQLKATLADNVSSYDAYKIVFHDTLSAGLTYNKDAVVKFGEADVTSNFTITEENGTLTISCDNVKAFGAGNKAVITVEYTATLNENAVLGSAGNPNVVYLEYSNNPNWDVSFDENGKPENPGEDGKDNDGDGEIDEEDEKKEPTGETPEDKDIVFNYKLTVNKVDEQKNPLAGAGFTLYKKNAAGEYVQVGEELFGAELTTFEWKGLDDGDYKLEETTTPAGYNTIAPIEFTITAEHDLESDDPQLIVLDGGDLFTGEVDTDDILSADVENKSGITLPETGGIGTTIFYVLGGLLVLGAVVLLITKKRMSAAE